MSAIVSPAATETEAPVLRQSPPVAKQRRRVDRRIVIGAVSFLAAIAAWFALSAAGFVTGGRFPTPADIWRSAAQIAVAPGYAGGTLVQHILQSCKLVLFGFLVAVGTGVPLGLLMGASRRIDALVGPVFSLLRPIPPLAWIPLAILWLGLGDSAKIFLIWVSAFTPSVINTYAGVRNIDGTLVEAARVHGARFGHMLRHVMIPGALPMIFTGLRLSLQTAWMTLVAAELVGAYTGLGKVLATASLDINPGMILFAMAWVGVLGFAMTKALERLEGKVLPWLQP